MTRTIHCTDGAAILGETEDELVAGMEAHFREAYPELAGQLSREEILRLAVPEPRTEKTDRAEVSVTKRNARQERLL
jgi:hypothetical protein